MSFKDIHPSGTGRRPLGSLKGQDLPPESMKGGSKPNESRWIRCHQCGFPIDTERDYSDADEAALTYPTTTVTDGAGTAYSAQDVVVNAGCPFCGAARSAKGPQPPSR